MSEPLQDLRGKITAETHCALTAYCRANGVERSELVRQILHKWAMRQIHGASVLTRCLAAKGIGAASEGIAGNLGESLEWDDES